MVTTTISIVDMHCASCSSKITNALKQQRGVQDIKINPLHRRIFVVHDPVLTGVDIVGHIARLGFTPLLDSTDTPDGTNADKDLLKRLGVAGICTMQIMMIQIALYAGEFQGMASSMAGLLGYASLVFCIPIVSYAAVPFFRNGFSVLRGRPPVLNINMDTPIALAIAIAFFVSLHALVTQEGAVYFDSVAMFAFLLLGARYLDQRLRNKFKVADQLTATLPKTVQRLAANGRYETVNTEDVRCGDRLFIAEGAQLPVDGILHSSDACLDTSLLTGESEPRTFSSGAELFAGTVNTGAGFELEASRGVEHSRVAQIDRMADAASAAKLSLVRTADRVARVFIPTILTLALVTYLYWHLQGAASPISYALAVLVVSCPCALSLAVPAAVSAAVTALRRQGLLVRNSQVLENITALRHVFFDKTGTLTIPVPRLSKITPLGRHSETICLRLAAALQRYSSHPLSVPFAIYDAGDVVNNIEVARSKGVSGNISGQRIKVGSADYCGVADQCSGTTHGKQVYLTIDHALAAVFELHNPIRTDAATLIDALKRRDLTAHMLSGDNPEQCQPVAESLGIHCLSKHSPEDKLSVLKSNAGVLYVGDGLNDLPALTAADVSVSTMETIDLVKSKADVLMLTEQLSQLSKLFEIGARFRRILRQNLAWAVGYNFIAIPLAMTGLATPWMAALGMSASSLLVMANAGRLLRN